MTSRLQNPLDISSAQLAVGWQFVQARRVFRERKTTDVDDKPLLSVTQEYGVLSREESDIRVWNPSADTSGYKLVRPGDYVISLRSFQGGIEQSDVEGIVSPAYTPCYSSRLKHPQLHFLRHYFKSRPFISALQPLTSGIRQGKNISFADFGEMLLPIPEPDLAGAIAEFLDRETAKIDTLIEKKQRLLDLLEEKRTALITRAVTRGRDPDVAMKDSGVEWIREIPEHWEATALKRWLSSPITDGPHETPIFVAEGIPFLSAEAVTSSGLDFARRRGDISAELHQAYAQKVQPARGDILFCKSGATTGKMALVETDEVFSIWSPLAVLRSDRQKLHPRYLAFVLQASYVQNQIRRTWSMGTQPNISMGSIAELYVIAPPLGEQSAILSYLDEHLSNLSVVYQSVTRAVGLLREYRSAVISAAVTGQIDIYGEAAAATV